LRKRCQWIFNHAPWTQDEEDFLRDNRGTMTAAQMAAALPGRTKDSVQSRCNQLAIFKYSRAPGKRRLIPWSADEIATLERHAGRLPPSIICYLFLTQRTPDSIYQKIQNLGLPMWSWRSASPTQADLQVAA
jgi:hypothetical protein